MEKWVNPVSVFLPIACAINDRYVLPLAVMLESLKQHLRPGVQPRLYLAHAGIHRSGLDRISAIVETTSVPLSAAQLAAVPHDAHFPPQAAFPLLLSEALPAELDRVLFLDADLLVLDDLWRLWEAPLDGHPVAAVADGAVPCCSSPRGVKDWRALGISPEAPYFNAGVLSIDLRRWRERQVTARALRFLASSRDRIDFLHQGALNAVLWDDWQPLDVRWNLLASRAGRVGGAIPDKAWRNPGIVHFAGSMKPWRVPVGGPFNERYRAVMERVLPSLATEPVTPRDRLKSLYDRRFRALCFPLERLLWSRRLI
jgi:lipopolysaccharide biosynthesis glycosyltransferase